jgi:hypothetical protein
VFLGALPKNHKRTGDKLLRSVILPIVIVLSQATQPIITSKSYKWCFNRGQGAQLCEQTQDDCAKLRGLNPAIAKSPCKRIELPEVKLSPIQPG